MTFRSDLDKIWTKPENSVTGGYALMWNYLRYSDAFEWNPKFSCRFLNFLKFSQTFLRNFKKISVAYIILNNLRESGTKIRFLK